MGRLEALAGFGNLQEIILQNSSWMVRPRGGAGRDRDGGGGRVPRTGLQEGAARRCCWFLLASLVEDMERLARVVPAAAASGSRSRPDADRRPCARRRGD